MPAPLSDREPILARIREALRISARPPAAPTPPKPEQFREWLPAVGPSYEEQVKAFAAQALVLKADFFRLPDMIAAREKIRELAATEKWDRIATHDAPLPAALLQDCPVPLFRVAPGYDRQALEACPVGVTGCEALIAQTGSVLVSAPSAGGRTLSVLPPHHVVIAMREQLVPDLPAAFSLMQRRYAAALPGFFSIITGPSRTGDIERILVLGAHGPYRLAILLVDEAPQ